jgi:hypothetical protein
VKFAWVRDVPGAQVGGQVACVRVTGTSGFDGTPTATLTDADNADPHGVAPNTVVCDFVVTVGGDVGAACGTLGGGLGGCGLTAQPSVGSAGSVTWSLAGSLSPGASGTVSFQVRVQ